MREYFPRIVDAELADKLTYAGAVVVRGPKWCGKTATALQQAESTVFMQDPDIRENNLALAEAKPSMLLQGARPRLIDEWQEAPQLWDAVRFAVDLDDEPGLFMLTGSATPERRPRHTGTGRMSFLDMRPMSLYESRDSTGDVSLARLFDSPDATQGESAADVETLAYLTCRGGWPRAVTVGSQRASLRMAHDYLTAIAEEDISRVDGVARSPRYARLIAQAYARCSATQADMGTIRKDVKERGSELSRETVNAYVAALRNLYVIEDAPAWSPSLHAKSRIVTTPARYFVDPSIAAAALGATPRRLFADLSTFGMLFETLCVRDLRVYAEALGGKVYHYRDNTGLEVDIVIELEDGRYGLFEVKLGSAQVDAAAKSLTKLAEKVNRSIMGTPAVMAVLTPGGYAYQRDDGVCVVPVTCLAP